MLICVPLMFVGKPLFQSYKQQRESHEREGFAIIGSSREPPATIQLQQLQHHPPHHHHTHQEQQHQHQQQQVQERRRRRSSSVSLLPLVGDDCEGDDEGRPQIGANAEAHAELWLHGLIEGIEFVLGTISNTASYLRLWALSLAHQQLSIIFFEKTVGAAFEPHQTAFQMTLKLLLGFPVFFFLTIFVMVAMEALECFLHALRLQWVEFQNKFYKGDGIAFQPLDLNSGRLAHPRSGFHNVGGNDGYEIWTEEDLRQGLTIKEVNDHRVTPEYEVLFSQKVGAEDVYLGLSDRDASTDHCETLVIHLPGALYSQISLEGSKFECRP
ncbi:hypothetical protein ACSSS7_001350 [Eimeria intestinalis]